MKNTKNILSVTEMQDKIASGEANQVWAAGVEDGGTGAGIYVYQDTMLYFDETTLEVDEATEENINFYKQV
jgi:hypothetical protein